MLIREPVPEDLPLVHDAFIKGVRECPAVQGVSRAFLISMLDRCLADPSWHVAILCPDDSIPDEIAGFAIWRSPTEIFWLATKPRYESLGFARALLAHIGAVPGPICCPFVPTKAAAMASRHGYRLIARPYMIIGDSRGR